MSCWYVCVYVYVCVSCLGYTKEMQRGSVNKEVCVCILLVFVYVFVCVCCVTNIYQQLKNDMCMYVFTHTIVFMKSDECMPARTHTIG